MDVQSIRFDKKLFTKKQAQEKAKKLGYKIYIQPNPQYENFHAFRQIQPEKFIKSSFRTKKLKGGILLILGKLKK